MVEWLIDFWNGLPFYLQYLLQTVGFILLLVLPLLTAVAFIVYGERKIWAAMQMRRGPNVVGIFGLLQSFADGMKLVFKETIIPAAANKGVFLLAPVIMFTFALIAWAVIPWWDGGVIADLNVGILYILGISSLGVYGVIMSGWASNSRYPFLGSLRSAAQMVSYEVSIGFVLVTVLIWTGSLNLSDVVRAQAGGMGHWNLWLFFPMFVIFFISALAETNRAPFDLPEAESELVAGYQTEYSSMAFGLFWLGEYGNILLMCALTSVLFFGGWYAPFPALDFIPGIIWMVLKILFFFFIFAWVKVTVPRYRYDQLMRLGWKVFLPISLGAVIFYAGLAVALGKV